MFTITVAGLILVAKIYCLSALIFWFILAFLSGFHSIDPKKEDFFISLVWPIYVMNLLGLITKLIITYISNRVLLKKNKEK